LIVGDFGERAPIISAKVYLPPPAGQVIDVDSLVDTGAAFTLLNPSDIVRFEPRALSRLAVRGNPLRTVGGKVQALTALASIQFVHEAGAVTNVHLPLILALTDPPDPSLPSLLGMDILSLGTLPIAGPTRTVSFDVESRDFELSRP
jgi:hypothetical protein